MQHMWQGNVNMEKGHKWSSGAGVLHVELSLVQSGIVSHVAVGRLISMGGSVQHVWEIYKERA